MHLGNVQAVIMADCNYLKQTNDTKWHEFGDMLLQRVADGIKAVLPEKCIAMRVGGDEISMVCPHTSREKAEALVQKMKEQMVKRSDEILHWHQHCGEWGSDLRGSLRGSGSGDV